MMLWRDVHVMEFHVLLFEKVRCRFNEIPEYLLYSLIPAWLVFGLTTASCLYCKAARDRDGRGMATYILAETKPLTY